MAETDFDRDLAQLNSAEDFLDYFGVPHAAAVVEVYRLHILQRFHDYLARGADADDAGPEERRARYRASLTQAYQDFVDSVARTERVFRVFRTRDPREGFVPLSDLSRRPKDATSP